MTLGATANLIFKKGSYALAIKVVAMASTLFFVSAMGFLLTKEVYGGLAGLTSTMLLAGAFGSFGQRELMVRDIAKVSSGGEASDAYGVVARSTSWVLQASALVGLVIGVGLILRHASFVLVCSMFVLVVTSSIYEAWSGAGRSFGHYLWSLAPRDIFWRVGVVVLTGVCVLLFGLRFSENDIALLSAVVLIAVIALQGLMLRFTAFTFAPIWRAPRDIIRSSLNLATSRVSAQLSSNLDVIVVSSFISASVAAEYYPANRLALIVSFVFASMELVVGPRIAIAFHNKNLQDVKKVTSIATFFSLFTSVFLGIMLVLLFPLYGFAFPTSTHDTELALYILVSSQVIQVGMGCGGSILIMSGRDDCIRTINLVSIVGSGAFIWASAISGDIVMVALATAISVVVRKSVIVFYVHRYTGLYPFSISILMQGLKKYVRF